VTALGDAELIFAVGNLRSTAFPERLSAAASAGFTAIGMNLLTYDRLRRDGWTDITLGEVLGEHGLRLLELEVVGGFDADPESDHDRRLVRTDATTEARLFELADSFGCRHVQAVGSFGDQLGADAVERFAALCDRAAAHGLRVAIEYLPFSNIPDARVASQIVLEAGRSNGGLCVDSWHCFRGAGLGELTEVPLDRVVVVQLDDGPLARVALDDYLDDTRRNRVAPGDGDFDLVSFLRRLEGADAPISVEVLSDVLDVTDAADTAARLAAATRAVLAEAGRSTGGVPA
jgi:sugar phosphate isomerase/epimerase